MQYFKKTILSILTITLFLLINVITSYAVTPQSSPIYQGIDVSNWQGNINYARVKAYGIDIVYIKSSQGNNIKDPDFEGNYRNAKNNNLKVGVYHFLTATNTTEAREQAEFFCSVISKKSIDCKLAMDFEQFDGLSKREINDVSRAFLTRVKEITKKDLIIYSDLSNARDTFEKDLANEYPLWIAYYEDYNRLNDINTSWNNWIGIQYTDRGIVRGIYGNVDRDLFTKEIFLSNNNRTPSYRNTNISPSSPKETREVSHIVYIVQKCDTLTSISKKYNVTVNHITQINNIKNPDLIFPNQKIRITSNEKLIPKIEKKESNSKQNCNIDRLNEIIKRLKEFFDNLFKF